MDARLLESLRTEKSENYSGPLLRFNQIPILKESDYFVERNVLDGDAPKQFIKAYFFEPDSGVKKHNLRTWPSFIAKSAEKWYPHESVVEYTINRIGIGLGLDMNEVKLVIANGQIRFLSRYFLKSNEVLVHGAEICGEYLDDQDLAKQIADNKRTSRELFTFEFICDALKFVFPEALHNLTLGLVKMITFDAIVGNNDRHFYNWGVINTVKKSPQTPKFAPIYDSARGLMWNESEEKVRIHYKNGASKVLKYIKNAEPRISLEKKSDVNHFELVSCIREMDEEYNNLIRDLVSKEKENRIMKMLNHDTFKHFSRERCEMMNLVLRERFAILRKN